MTIHEYEKFQPLDNARLALNYLTKMTDPHHDNLPYWIVVPHSTPAYAKHCRVDDAELVASWYEGLDCVRKMLDTDEGEKEQQSFYRHLMKSWGEHGLRFHEDYPWSNANHSSFHEMGYVLSALNKILENNPEDAQAEKRAHDLVRGLLSLAHERKIKTFWSGDFIETEPVYEFPNDIYMKDGGFDMTRHTGRGEQCIRNGVLVPPLVRRWELTGDEKALDLALGLTNHLLGVSRYFNYRMEFFGHVHSAVWFAAGAVKLGRLTGNKRYVTGGKGIYDYVRSISSSFGWVPEYAQWHPMDEEHCETCCIKDMIECGSELIKAGYEEYWIDLVLFSRNHLIESQVAYTGFVTMDNSLPDTADTTYRDMDKRIAGGFSGGSLVNSISLTRFRSIAGCCVGTGPQAIKLIWDLSVDIREGRITIHIPFDRHLEDADITSGYPDEGKITVLVRKKMDVAFHIYDWMGEGIHVTVDGNNTDYVREGNILVCRNMPAGSEVMVTHGLITRKVREKCCGREYTVHWRGPDVVDIFPRGEALRLYQKMKRTKKEYPAAGELQLPDVDFIVSPTQMKK